MDSARGKTMTKMLGLLS